MKFLLVLFYTKIIRTPLTIFTNIRFEIPENSFVKIEIYSITGKLLKTLVENEIPEGIFTTKWNVTDSVGNSVSTGIYIYIVCKAEIPVSVKK